MIITFGMYYFIQGKSLFYYFIFGIVGIFCLRITELNPFFQPAIYELNWLLVLIPHIALVFLYKKNQPFKLFLDKTLRSYKQQSN